MDSEVENNFYITLPSNSSARYFPHNTQASFRTKLSAPLSLSGDWEVGLSEIFIPRNWFNVNQHNNGYTVSFETKEWVKINFVRHKIEWDYDESLNIFRLCETINNVIGNVLEDKTAVVFKPFENTSSIIIEIKDGFEIDFRKEESAKLLYMLYLPIEDKIINKTENYRYRTSTQFPFKVCFYIFNRNPKTSSDFLIPLIPIKDGVKPLNNVNDLIDILRSNLDLLKLKDYVRFSYYPVKKELVINVKETSVLLLTADHSPALLRKLGVEENIIVKGSQTFKINPLIPLASNEYVTLRVYKYYESLDIKQNQIDLKIPVGMYKTADNLFEAFHYINLSQLPDLRVVMKVPEAHEIKFSRGLADMLGFETTDFASGSYASKYPLELDGGITEIFVYSDLVVSHNIGDVCAPLIRIIPCLSEKSEQIVKNYQRPLYFPIRKNYIETIEIELKTSSGNDIIFSGGKTFVVLSFRRKKL